MSLLHNHIARGDAPMETGKPNNNFDEACRERQHCSLADFCALFGISDITLSLRGERLIHLHIKLTNLT